MHYTLILATLSLLSAAHVQAQCTEGACYTSPSNATASGCETWAGGVDAWATCGFEGAVTCTTCFPCQVDKCYTSPTQATGAGCTQWAGGDTVWEECGFEGAIQCLKC